MEITYEHAYQCASVLRSLDEKGLFGFAIAKNLRKLDEELVEYTEKRTELVQKYGTIYGTKYEIKNENIKEFLDELGKYGNETFEFNPQTVNSELFCSGSLTSSQMYLLDWMVKE